MTPIMNLHNIDVAQFLAVLKLIEGGKIAEASIYCENKNDESKLFRFNFFGDMSEAQVG